MATITYTKQYEFCDDIKAHILSFLKPKKMKTFIPSPELLQKLKNWRWRFNYTNTFKSPLYHIRMEMPYRQLEYEVSNMGGLANYNKGRNYLGTPFAGAETVYIDAIASIGVHKSGLQPHLEDIRRGAHLYECRQQPYKDYIKYSKRFRCGDCKKTMTVAKAILTEHKWKCKRTPDVVKPSTKTYSVAEAHKRELIECVKCYEKFQRKGMSSHYNKCVLNDKYVMGKPPTHTLW